MKYRVSFFDKGVAGLAGADIGSGEIKKLQAIAKSARNNVQALQQLGRSEPSNSGLTIRHYFSPLLVNRKQNYQTPRPDMRLPSEIKTFTDFCRDKVRGIPLVYAHNVRGGAPDSAVCIVADSEKLLVFDIHSDGKGGYNTQIDYMDGRGKYHVSKTQQYKAKPIIYEDTDGNECIIVAERIIDGKPSNGVGICINDTVEARAIDVRAPKITLKVFAKRYESDVAPIIYNYHVYNGVKQVVVSRAEELTSE